MLQRLLATLCLLGCCALSWAAQRVELPVLELPDDEAAAVELLASHVYLPAEHHEAMRLVRGWNALVAAVAPERLVPTLHEIYGGNGHPWATDQGADLWAGSNEHARDLAVFDLRTAEGLPGVLLLATPDSKFAAAMQRHVDEAWLAAGHSEVPRPRVASSGISLGGAMGMIARGSGLAQLGWSNYLMIGVGLLLLYLGIGKGFEPLLLVPIATGCILVNAIGAHMADPPGSDTAGILGFFYEFGIGSGMFPLLIFLGVGALTDFGPLLSNPWSALLGGAAQFGIFGSFFLAASFGVFTLQEAGAIAIIGGADGPTSIYVASKLAPHLLGAVAVAAYSYMALVPIIQPPVMRALTTDAERKVMMTQKGEVSKTARILFPITVILLCILTLPDAVPLIGMLMFGNLLRESTVTERLVKTAQNELINLVTIGLGLAVGTKLSAEAFLNLETLLIIVLGCAAFVVGTAAGVLGGKAMCKLTKGRINPLIGAAGVSAVPMAARVAHNEGQRVNKRNMLLMHAMGPNVAGVIGSAVAAGILLALLGG